jgi:hypothetical protein
MYEPRLCSEYMKGLDAFVYFARKDKLAQMMHLLICQCVFVVLVNIARMRTNTIQMMC